MESAGVFHNKVAEIINGIVENHQGEQPRGFASRDGITLGGLANGMMGTGVSAFQAGEEMLFKILSESIDLTDNIPFIGPYIPTGIALKTTYLIGKGCVYIPGVINNIGGGIINNIPGSDIPIPGTEDITPTSDEIEDAVDETVEWILNDMPSTILNGLPNNDDDEYGEFPGEYSDPEDTDEGWDELPGEYSWPDGIWGKHSAGAINTGNGFDWPGLDVAASICNSTANIRNVIGNSSEMGVNAAGEAVRMSVQDIESRATNQIGKGYDFLINEGRTLWNMYRRISGDISHKGFYIGYGIYGIPGTIIGK